MKKHFILILLAIVALTVFTAGNFFEKEHLQLSSIESSKKWSDAKPDYTSLKSGDLIFRHGRGFISNALMSLGQREKKYSHAGILTVENGAVYVYHAIGGEENITNKLRKDRIESFCNPRDVHSFAIYRTDLTSAQLESVIRIATEYFNDGLEFDTHFDLSTDDKMYCTEFVYKVFQRALGVANYISLSAVTGKEFIACDDIYCNGHCAPVYAYDY